MTDSKTITFDDIFNNADFRGNETQNKVKEIIDTLLKGENFANYTKEAQNIKVGNNDTYLDKQKLIKLLGYLDQFPLSNYIRNAMMGGDINKPHENKPLLEAGKKVKYIDIAEADATKKLKDATITEKKGMLKKTYTIEFNDQSTKGSIDGDFLIPLEYKDPSKFVTKEKYEKFIETYKDELLTLIKDINTHITDAKENPVDQIVNMYTDFLGNDTTKAGVERKPSKFFKDDKDGKSEQSPTTPSGSPSGSPSGTSTVDGLNLDCNLTGPNTTKGGRKRGRKTRRKTNKRKRRTLKKRKTKKAKKTRKNKKTKRVRFRL